jgi:hypothetical protein
MASRDTWLKRIDHELPYGLKSKPDAERIKSFYQERRRSYQRRRNGCVIVALCFSALTGLQWLLQGQPPLLGLGFAAFFYLLYILFHGAFWGTMVPDDLLEEYVRLKSSAKNTAQTRAHEDTPGQAPACNAKQH